MEREAPFYLEARSRRSLVEQLWIAKRHQAPERSARFARCARSLTALALPNENGFECSLIPFEFYFRIPGAP